jgi:Holliday junction resolvase RusA-like endonuclease
VSRIKIKPLSVNQCWQGKRFKTKEYLTYEKTLLTLLPKIELPKPPLRVIIDFGVSNAGSDWDNPIKPFVDILQKKYGFNDKDIFEGVVKKSKVKKGEEYINFKIESL